MRHRLALVIAILALLAFGFGQTAYADPGSGGSGNDATQDQTASNDNSTDQSADTDSTTEQENSAEVSDTACERCANGSDGQTTTADKIGSAHV